MRTPKILSVACTSQDDGEDQQRGPLCRCIQHEGAICKRGGCGRDRREPGMQQHVNRDGSAIVDAGGDPELADQVEPAGEPAPAGAAKLGSPVVQAAGCRIGRGQFGHAQRDDDHEDGDERPADGGGCKTAMWSGSGRRA